MTTVILAIKKHHLKSSQKKTAAALKHARAKKMFEKNLLHKNLIFV
jgi:hypothetical protein